LNLARAVAREAEVAALTAFAPQGPTTAEGATATAPPLRADICLALNRVSSALYLLACKYVAGRYDGSRRPMGPVRGWRPPK
jgi:ethanolamine utilization cobalamin adenosyltransferase